jgi:ABC-type transport system involved in multi-copper enzyme maturation permease subunit
MNAQSIPVRPGRIRRYPIPWRPMTRVTWLQHRSSIITAAVLFAGYALAIIESGLESHSTNSLATQTTRLSLLTIALLVLPVLAGMFIGAPLLARELESGSFRFAWTQGIGRTRWVLAKMVLLLGAGAAAAGILGFLTDWYGAPFEAAGLASRWQGGQFNTTLLTLPAWTLCSLAAGTFAGVLIGRVVAAMAATAASVGGLIVLDFMRLHDWFLGIAAGVTRGSPSGTGLGALNTFAEPGGIPGPPGSWLVNGWYTGSNGQRLSSAAANSLVNKLLASRSTVALSNPARWLALHHGAYWISYQAADRFWVFQGAEAGILLAITAAFVIGTIRLVGCRGDR